jgi:hypothetical protein
MAIELAPKRLELIKDMVPMVHTVAMLWNARDLGMTLRYHGAADVARTIGARVQPLAVREPDDLREWRAPHSPILRLWQDRKRPPRWSRSAQQLQPFCADAVVI